MEYRVIAGPKAALKNNNSQLMVLYNPALQRKLGDTLNRLRMPVKWAMSAH